VYGFGWVFGFGYIWVLDFVKSVNIFLRFFCNVRSYYHDIRYFYRYFNVLSKIFFSNVVTFLF
jgi:hypothetical protein